MRLIRELSDLRELPRAAAVTIGNFDGVHLAHQQLLRRVVETARSTGAVATAVTFEPHPLKVLSPTDAPRLLTALDRKVWLIEAQGIDVLVVLPFTKELAQLSPSEFVRTVLVRKLRAASVHVGSNFRFGHRHSGDVEALAEFARRSAFKLEVLPILEVRGERVSSTCIRERLGEGRVPLAARLLGRPHAASGPIVPGLGVGKTQTVPTLNLAPVELQLPKIGVYVTRTRIGNTLYESVTNVGHKPTFGEHRLTVESYLVNFAGGIHEPEMEVEFLYRLRDEMKFPNPAALKAQIQKDARRAQQFFRLLKVFGDRKTPPLVPTARSNT